VLTGPRVDEPAFNGRRITARESNSRVEGALFYGGDAGGSPLITHHRRPVSLVPEKVTACYRDGKSAVGADVR
jgi:hypothetical protein